MATEIERTPDADPNMWRAVGRLEGDVASLLEGQRELQEGQRGLQEGQRDLGRRSDELNRRIDRLFYAILGMGGALLATLLATEFFGS